jgi:hypothetical protein
MNGSPQPLSWLGPCPRNDYTVIASDILQNPSLKRWLGGIDPAWTLLDRASTAALRHPPSQPAGAIRLASNFSPDEIATSAVARNALILLHTVAAEPGLRMTATGNLSRRVVAQMCDLFIWLGFDKTEAFRLHKVMNEPDFLPLFFVRHLVEAARLVRQHKGHLKITPFGRQVLEDPGHRPCKQSYSISRCGISIWRISVKAFITDGRSATSVSFYGHCRSPRTTGRLARA